MTIAWKEAHSNNYDVGRGGKSVQYIVMHWIVGTLASADATFANPDRRASAHYGVGGGAVHQYVDEKNTAWHCGNLDMNQRSIGIEHEGGPNLPISDATYRTSARLVADIAKRLKIPLDRTHVRGHREISATQCPGTLDIDRIIRDAKTLQGGEVTPPMAKTITIETTLFEELVGKATKYDAFFDAGYSDIRVVSRRMGELERDLTAEREKIKLLETEVSHLKEELAKAGSSTITVPISSTTGDTASTSSNPVHSLPLSVYTTGDLISELFKRIFGRG